MKNKLTKEQKVLLRQYFNAAANLYGIISLGELLKIYNSQNPPITKDQMAEFSEEIDKEGNNFFIINLDNDEVEPMSREIVAEYIFAIEKEDEYEDYYMLKLVQGDKPYFVTRKEKLLRYADDFYYEKTPEFLEMRSYLRNYSNLSKDRADDLSSDIVCYTAINGCSIKRLERIFNLCGLKFKNSSIQLGFEKLALECMDNVRLHSNRGFTNKELENMSYG